MLVRRGTTDWSRAFAYVWFTAFGAAVVLALVALLIAALARHDPFEARLFAIALAVPALCLAAAVGFLVFVVSVLHPAS